MYHGVDSTSRSIISLVDWLSISYQVIAVLGTHTSIYILYPNKYTTNICKRTWKVLVNLCSRYHHLTFFFLILGYLLIFKVLFYSQLNYFIILLKYKCQDDTDVNYFIKIHFKIVNSSWQKFGLFMLLLNLRVLVVF